MGRRYSVDTTFLVDLQREARTRREGRAHILLRQLGSAELCVSSVAFGEFAAGFVSQEHPAVRGALQAHTHLACDTATAFLYASVSRELRARGALIGTNDLWIGCTSLQHDLPLLTANVKEFRRIPGLEVIDYLAQDGLPGAGDA